MRTQRFILPSLALGLAAILFAPAERSEGFSVIGGSLSAEGQRDFRIRNTFADAQANNYPGGDSQFPGWAGADLAIWKGAVEWGSTLHGDGTGTPGQLLGEGEANFDFAFMGAATGSGNSNNNIVSPTNSCQNGVLAFVETPISDGWRMRFCEGILWADGPGVAVGNEFNIQGVATHEFGHSLGLGHSTNGNAIMFPSTADGNQRNIASDDINGVQFVYGAASGAKPVITGVEVCPGSVTITGTNFSGSGGEVWFTNRNVTSTGSDPRVRVTSVSSTNGGTEITVNIPANAGDGDVLVKQSGAGHSTLSNAWPFEAPDDGVAEFKNGNGTNLAVYSSLNPPNAGQTWNTTVTLQPQDARVLIAINSNGANCLNGFSPAFLNGTQLLVPGPYLRPHRVSLTGNFTFNLNNDCALLGAQFCTQGFGVELNPLRVFGRNALEVTIGG